MLKTIKFNKIIILSLLVAAASAMPMSAQKSPEGNPTETVAGYSNPALEGHLQALLAYYTARTAGIEISEVEPSALTVDLLKSRIDPKYEFLIGDLAKLHHRFGSEDEMRQFYTEGVFLSSNGDYNDIFAILLVKNESGKTVMNIPSLDKVRQEMKSQLELEVQSYADLNNDTDMAQEATPAPDHENPADGEDDLSEEKEANPMWYILGIMSGIFIGVVAYLFSAKLSMERKKNDEINGLRAKIDELTSLLKTSKSVDTTEKETIVADNTFQNTPEEISVENLFVKKGLSDHNEAVADSKSEDKPEMNLPAVLYVGVPAQGIFGEGYTSDRPSKTLYRIDRIDSAHAKFSFISSDLNYRLAKSNITQFVEAAADIENEDRRINFTSIVTVNPGEVEKCDGGWKITKKAVIRFI